MGGGGEGERETGGEGEGEGIRGKDASEEGGDARERIEARWARCCARTRDVRAEWVARRALISDSVSVVLDIVTKNDDYEHSMVDDEVVQTYHNIQ